MCYGSLGLAAFMILFCSKCNCLTMHFTYYCCLCVVLCGWACQSMPVLIRELLCGVNSLPHYSVD